MSDRIAATLAFVLGAGVSTSAVAGDDLKTDAILALHRAIDACSDAQWRGSSISVEKLQSGFELYRAKRDEGFKIDPRIKTSTTVYMSGDDKVRMSYAQWVTTCDAWFPKAITEHTAKEAKDKQQDAARAVANKKQHDADAKHQEDVSSWNAKYSAKLKGDRKRLWKDKGWPAATSGDDDDLYQTEKSYAGMVTAKQWIYKSMQNSHGEYLCTEIYSFSGDKKVKRATEGVCH